MSSDSELEQKNQGSFSPASALNFLLEPQNTVSDSFGSSRSWWLCPPLPGAAVPGIPSPRNVPVEHGGCCPC